MEQVKAEPVAWTYEHPTWPKCVYLEKQDMSRLSAAMVETPLYATPQPAAVDGLVEHMSDMMREVFISGADWGRTRPGHFSDYLADAIKPHLEALTKIKQS